MPGPRTSRGTAVEGSYGSIFPLGTSCSPCMYPLSDVNRMYVLSSSPGFTQGRDDRSDRVVDREQRLLTIPGRAAIPAIDWASRCPWRWMNAGLSARLASPNAGEAGTGS